MTFHVQPSFASSTRSLKRNQGQNKLRFRAAMLEALEKRQLMAADLTGFEFSDPKVAEPFTAAQIAKSPSKSPAIPSKQGDKEVAETSQPRMRSTWDGNLSPAVQSAIAATRNLKQFSPKELEAISDWAIVTSDPPAVGKRLESLKPERIVDRTSMFGNKIAVNVLEVQLGDARAEQLFQSLADMKEAVLDILPLIKTHWEATGTLDPASITDGNFANQWHLDATASDTQFGINAEEAWGASTGEGVRVSIVDSRQEMNHPDLAGNLLAGMSYDDLNLDWNGDGVGDNNPGVFLAPGSPLWPNIVDTDTDGDGVLDRDAQRQQSHGTAVAGLAVGDDDGSGIVGVAPDAGYAAYNFLEGPQSIPDTFSNANIANTDVFNASWGVGSSRQLRGQNFLDLQAFENASTDAVFVKSAGNNRNANRAGTYLGWDRANYAQGHLRQAMVIGAARQDGGVESYSNPGSNLLVSAPVNETGVNRNATTSDVTDAGTAGNQRGYNLNAVTNGFNGTSAAAPMVSGVIALMLEVNPDLGWRDIQNILIDTAQKNGLIDVDNDGEMDGGDADADGAIDNFNLRTTFSSSVDVDGNGTIDGALDTDRDGTADPYHTGWFQNRAGNWVSDNFGFGIVDAAAAVKLAEQWTPLGAELVVSSPRMLGGDVAEGALGGLGSLSAIGGYTTESNLKVEWAEVTVKATIPAFENLMLVLRSPSGTQSVLAAPGGSAGQTNVDSFTFSTNQFWDESAEGQWTLEALDVGTNDNQTIRIDDWQLNIYGSGCCDASPLIVESFDDLDIETKKFAELALIAGGLDGADYDFETVEQIGSGLAMGTFSKGHSSDLPIDQGLLFSTGNVKDAVGPNLRPDTSTNWDRSGHQLLDNMTGEKTYDAAGLGMIITVKQGVQLSYQALFGSEEFDEWVGSEYNDGAGIFVAELKALDSKIDPDVAQNILRQPNGGELTVNELAKQEGNGVVAGKFYDPNPVCGDMNWEYDGSSTLIVTNDFWLSAGHTYYIGIMVADAKDSIYDSALAISLDHAQSKSSKQFEKGEKSMTTFKTEITPKSFKASSAAPVLGFAPKTGSLSRMPMTEPVETVQQFEVESADVAKQSRAPEVAGQPTFREDLLATNAYTSVDQALAEEDLLDWWRLF